MIHIYVHIFYLFMYSFRFAKDLDFETWEATNGFPHRFCMRYGVLSKHITGESLDCLTMHSSWKKFWPLCWWSMNHKMSTMLMRHLYITSVYLTGLMHLSMKVCVYSQSSQITTDQIPTGRIPTGRINAGWIPTGWINAGRITNVLFLFCSTQVRGSKQWNSKDRLSVMFTVNMTGSDKRPPLVIGKAARPSALKKKNVLWKNLSIITTPEPEWMVQSSIHTWKTGMMS